MILQGGDDIATATVIPSLPYTDAGTTAGIPIITTKFAHTPPPALLMLFIHSRPLSILISLSISATHPMIPNCTFIKTAKHRVAQSLAMMMPAAAMVIGR
jgi:hypothetical protein